MWISASTTVFVSCQFLTIENCYLLLQTFPNSKLVQLLQGMPWVDRVFTVDEVKGTGVTRKLYRIAKELPHDKWQVQLVSVKEGTDLVQSPVSETTVKRIGTHDGTFHCDEALACFMLKLLPEYEDAQVIRCVFVVASVFSVTTTTEESLHQFYNAVYC